MLSFLKFLQVTLPNLVLPALFSWCTVTWPFVSALSVKLTASVVCSVLQSHGPGHVAAAGGGAGAQLGAAVPVPAALLPPPAPGPHPAALPTRHQAGQGLTGLHGCAAVPRALGLLLLLSEPA